MSIYTFQAADAQGREISLADYQGKVLLIVNTATRCGLTPQYAALQALHERYAAQGFEILDFPCNQFRNQAPEGGAEIAQFCETRFGTRFPVFDKIDVNGANTHPLYIYLKQQQPHDSGGSLWQEALLRLAALGSQHRSGDIKWNFTKFLVNRKGEVVARFAPSAKPESLEAAVQALL